MITEISEAKLVGPDQIEIKVVDDGNPSRAVGMSLRDFLHFGHFLVALRAAMRDGRLPDCKIERGRLRESWEPRRDVLERKLCDGPIAPG